MDGYMAAAKHEGWLARETLVIFPEFIGTWLVVVDEHQAVLRAKDVNQAMQRLVLRRLPSFLATLPRAKGRERISDSVFRLKAGRMARVYQDTFSRLASGYEVTIVAGSTVLPTPAIFDGELQVGAGVLQNVGLVFQPDGRPHPDIIRKVYPLQVELAFLSPGSLDQLPVYNTPVGKLAPLICADSWYPQVYEKTSRQHPRIYVVLNNHLHEWDAPWGGYDPGPGPTDVDPNDVGKLQDREAWLKYALPGRMKSTKAAVGMHVFFRGQMWDLKSYGQTIIVTRNETMLAPYVEGAALVNYWIGSGGSAKEEGH